MSLKRSVGHLGDLYEKKLINVWNIHTKQIVFTGDATDVGRYLNISDWSVNSYLKRKSVRKKQFALRLAKNNI